MFSVIIPNYNNSRYLDELFESLISQTFTDYEIIFIDDISEDDSLEKAEEWKKKFKQNFTIVKNQEKRWNGGSRNVGIDLAKGEYIIFIDSDDKFSSNDCFEKINELIIVNNHPDLIRLSYWYCDDKERLVDLSHQKSVKELSNACDVACWTKIVRRDKIVRFPENTLMEDVVQHLKQTDCIHTIASTNLGLVKWNRKNPKSVSTYRDKRTSELDKKWISSMYRYYADLLDIRAKNVFVRKNLNQRIKDTIENIKKDAFIQS